MMGTLTRIEEYMPDYYIHLTRNNRVEVIQFKLSHFKKEFNMEAKVLETIKNTGIEEGFPIIVSTLESEIENLGEVMIIPKGNTTLFAEFNLRQSLRVPGAHRPVELHILNHIARDIIGHLEALHGLGFVHANIKPQNIIISKGQAGNSYSLTSFCNSVRVLDEEGELIPQIKTGLSKGSLLYRSQDQINGLTPGWKDDLESLMYLLSFLHAGTLPVLSHLLKKKLVDPNMICEREVLEFRCQMKEEHFNGFQKNLPAQMQAAWSYIKQLTYKDKPDYTLLRLTFCQIKQEENQVLQSAKITKRHFQNLDISMISQNLLDDSWIQNSNQSFDLKVHESNNQSGKIQNKIQKIDKNSIRKIQLRKLIENKSVPIGME